MTSISPRYSASGPVVKLLAHQCADENEYQTSFTLLPKIAVSLSISGSRVLVVHVGGEEFVMDAYPQTNLPGILHNSPQDAVDSCRITLPILHQPVVNFLVDARSYQHFSRTSELQQLLVAQRRNIRIVNAGIISGSLSLGNPR